MLFKSVQSLLGLMNLKSIKFFLCLLVLMPTSLVYSAIDQDLVDKIDVMIYQYQEKDEAHPWDDKTYVEQFFMKIKNYGGATDLWARKALRGVNSVRDYLVFGDTIMVDSSWVHDESSRMSFELLHAYIIRGEVLLEGQSEQIKNSVTAYVEKRIIPLYSANLTLISILDPVYPTFYNVSRIRSSQLRTCKVLLL